MIIALERSLDAPPRPSFWQGVVFRFAFVYWMLFCIPIISGQIEGFDWIGKAIGSAWNALAVWVGKAILGIPYEINTAENGSGDKTIDWLIVFCTASLALLVTVVWSLMDRRRAHDARLRRLLRVLVRYTLALVILGYGLVKVFGGQFSPPGGTRLLQRFGDSSPMGLLWTFMGASPAYVIFSGVAETLGAMLVLFRRTTTLGALVLAAVLTNVVLLNFCYDVPVKINSSHYLAMCIFLLLPDIGRLGNVVLFNRATQPVAREPGLPRRWMRVTRVVIKYGVIGLVLFSILKDVAGRGGEERNSWYDGSWMATGFVRDGQEVPAIVTDATRWSRVQFQVWHDKSYVRWRFMNESRGDLYSVAVDETAHTMIFTGDPDDNPKPRPPPVTFSYARIDPTHVRLEGKLGGQQLVIQLERIDTKAMLLVSRGFHWINEEPFNR